MSLLQSIRDKANEKEKIKRICQTCGNLEQVTKEVIGCIALDKIILQKYQPYHGKRECDNWKERGSK